MKSFISPLAVITAALLAGLGTVSAAPALPNINTNNIVTITNAPYNAVGDGATDNTLAISNAIVAASSGGNVGGLLGGTVRIPAPGIFLCGPLTLKNNVNIQIDAGAILRMLPINLFTNYPSNVGGEVYGSLIYAAGLTNLAISGSGAIDGQGSPWWSTTGTLFNNRPYMIYFNSGCKRVLVQDVTISNAPAQLVVFKGKGGDITVQGVTQKTPPSFGVNPSHNTDGFDLVGTNILVQNCNISVGDDNLALGSSGGVTANLLVTNCFFGDGHGLSIGSHSELGVSNLTVINCNFSGTDNGIRLKCDNDRGGVVQNLNYFNIGMTNVGFPVLIYSYYNLIGTPSSITPNYAATQAVAAVTSLTPVWRNITFSNLTATSYIGRPVGVIWARTEMPATNIVFNRVNLTGDRNFCLYNVSGVQFIDSKITVSAASTFALFNAQVIITNSVPTNTLFTFDGLTTNGYGNSFAFYNAQASLKNTNTFDDGPLTLSASTLTISNDFTLFPTARLNYTLGTNTTRLAVVGNLALGGTNNISAGAGFTNGSYALMTYTGTLSGILPVLGTVPSGYNYAFDTNTAGQVNLIVSLPAPPAPTNLTASGTNLLINLKWNSVNGATSYNLKRGTLNNGPYPTVISGLIATNYADANVTNAVNYFYVVTAMAGGESTNSLQASAAPLPSNQPTNIVLQVVGNQMQLSWPQSHLGWQLQIQTNNLNQGLWTNWATVPNSTNVISTNIVINPTNGAVFLRLVYP